MSRSSSPTPAPGAATDAPAILPPSVAVVRGIAACRRGEWHSGLHYLRIAEERDGDVTLPGLYWSYLGLAVARCERRHDAALELCERAVTIEFFQPENFVNLAWVHLLSGNRRAAMAATERGRSLDAEHAGLREMAARLGSRRPPVLRFLRREHPINRSLGRWRHALEMRRAG